MGVIAADARQVTARPKSLATSFARQASDPAANHDDIDHDDGADDEPDGLDDDDRVSLESTPLRKTHTCPGW
jgi:hypothetical protein